MVFLKVPIDILYSLNHNTHTCNERVTLRNVPGVTVSVTNLRDLCFLESGMTFIHKMIFPIPTISHHSYIFFGYFISPAHIVSPVINGAVIHFFILWSAVIVISLPQYHSLPGSIV